MYVCMLLTLFYVGQMRTRRRLTHLKGRRPGGLRGTESPVQGALGDGVHHKIEMFFNGIDRMQ